MHWYEWMTIGIMVVVTILQTVRGVKAGGMGLPLFEAAGVIVAAVASTSFAHGLAGAIHINESVALLGLFIAFAFLGFIVARWLFALTDLSFQSLDGFFSFAFGFIMAWAIAHMFLRIMISAQGPNGEIAVDIPKSAIVREIFQFRTWNSLMQLLFRAKLAPDFNPNQG